MFPFPLLYIIYPIQLRSTISIFKNMSAKHSQQREWYKALQLIDVIPLLLLTSSTSGRMSMAGSTSHASRQFFPYVSSETDLQRYKAISFRNSSNNEPRSNSSISNIPSDLKSEKIKVSNIRCSQQMVLSECEEEAADLPNMLFTPRRCLAWETRHHRFLIGIRF